MAFSTNTTTGKTNWIQHRGRSKLSDNSEVSHSDFQQWQHSPPSKLRPTVTFKLVFVRICFPSQAQKRYIHEHNIWKGINLSNQHNFKSSFIFWVFKQNSVIKATPRAWKRIQNIIECHKTQVRVTFSLHQVSNFNNSF